MDSFTATELTLIPNILAELNGSFLAGKTVQTEWRKIQLRQLWNLIDENEVAIRNAIAADNGKPLVQSQALEIICVKNDIVHCLKNLDEWLAVETPDVPPPFENWSPVIYRRPKGTCLIIGTWNYPIALTLLPLIGVIACGNTGIVKPSEHAPHTATLLTNLLPQYLDLTCFKIINGDKEVVQALLGEPFGHILFTGGTAIGKEVMKAAAKHLTPVTLELGGRNSVIVTEKANLELTASRIAWAKFAIAGQTCFAPNQVLVHENVYDEFVASLDKMYSTFYAHKNEVSNVGRIINKQHWKRIMDLISATKGTITQGGNGDESALFIKPTIITDVLENDPVVETELFGPVLPVIKYSTTQDAKRLANSLSPAALALYVFSEDLAEANDFVSTCPAGTASINDVMAQIAPSSLPFGGVGSSGFGAYRGRASIDTFSHKQSVVTVPTVPEFEALLGWRYPQAESIDTVNFVKGVLEAKF